MRDALQRNSVDDAFAAIAKADDQHLLAANAPRF